MKPVTTAALAMLIAAAVTSGTPTASAETLREAMESLAHDVSRTLRRETDGPVLLKAVDAPFPDNAASLVRREFGSALERSGIELSERPTPVSVDLEYVRGERSGEYAARVHVRSAGNETLRTIERTFVLDDAVDRAVLEGLTYDATTSAEGASRVATRPVVQSALTDGNAVVVTERGRRSRTAQPGAGANERTDEEKVLVEVLADGRVVVTTGGTRIVVAPVDNANANAARSERRRVRDETEPRRRPPAERRRRREERRERRRNGIER